MNTQERQITQVAGPSHEVYPHDVDLRPPTLSSNHQASLKQWEAEQAARAQLQADIARKVAQERQAQLEEKNRRIQNVSRGKELDGDW